MNEGADKSGSSAQQLSFTRQQRLLSPAQYKHVLSQGKRVSGKYFRMCGVVRTDGSVDARLGLTIAKRSAKKAVDRNRVKRLARESFRHQQAQLGAIDVVVFANPSVVGADSADLRRHLDRQWHQLCRKCTPSSKSS
ncbi:MAG: ribonuclease P protein component [Granulosicoccaceae bacterium]